MNQWVSNAIAASGHGTEFDAMHSIRFSVDGPEFGGMVVVSQGKKFVTKAEKRRINEQHVKDGTLPYSTWIQVKHSNRPGLWKRLTESNQQELLKHGSYAWLLKKDKPSGIGKFTRGAGRVVENTGKRFAHGVKSVGKGAVSIVKGGNVVKSLGAMGKGTIEAFTAPQEIVEEIPLVGKPLAVVTGSPLSVASSVLSGERIDKVMLNEFKRQLRAAQELAPYAQIVVSFVPGVGQGVSGIIGAANALSQGKPMSDALIEAAKGALPGGPLVVAVTSAAIDVGVALIEGKPIEEVGLNALPLDKEQKDLLITASQTVKGIASGKSPEKILFEQADKVAGLLATTLPEDTKKDLENQLKETKDALKEPIKAAKYVQKQVREAQEFLPKDVSEGLTLGLAMGQAKNIQDLEKKALPETLKALKIEGNEIVGKNPVLKNGFLRLAKPKRIGYTIGTALSKHAVTPYQFRLIRGKLDSDQKLGFDIALSAHIGKLTTKVRYKNTERDFDHIVVKGMKGAKPKDKEAMKVALSLKSKDFILPPEPPTFFEWVFTGIGKLFT